MRRQAFAAAFTLLLAFSPEGRAAEKTSSDPERQREQESYAIGYQVGLSMTKDGVEADLDSLVRGLRDAVEGKEPQVGSAEMKRLIAGLRKKAREAELRKVQEAIVRNAEESETFLAVNRKRDGVQTTGSGLQYRVLREGDGAVPRAEDLVRVHYRGSFIDGTEFDNSYARGEPQTFQTDGVIKGWTEALQLMKVGSKWQLFVPPDLAYGRGGLGQKIPPNKVLVFEIELLAVEEGEKGGDRT